MAQDDSRPDPPGSQRRSIGARRNPASEAAVLAAASDVLRERGFGGFSIDEVARRAGAGKPTLYRWWPTRAALLRAVLSGDPAARPAEPDTGRLPGDLAAYTRALWAGWRGSAGGQALRGLIAEAQASEAALIVLWQEVVPEWERAVRVIFGRAAARREIEPADLDLLVELYAGFVWRRLVTGQIDDDRPAVERMARLLASGRGRKT